MPSDDDEGCDHPTHPTSRFNSPLLRSNSGRARCSVLWRPVSHQVHTLISGPNKCSYMQSRDRTGVHRDLVRLNSLVTQKT